MILKKVMLECAWNEKSYNVALLNRVKFNVLMILETFHIDTYFTDRFTVFLILLFSSFIEPIYDNIPGF